MSPNPAVERMSQRPLRALGAAAPVERLLAEIVRPISRTVFAVAPLVACLAAGAQNRALKLPEFPASPNSRLAAPPPQSLSRYIHGLELKHYPAGAVVRAKYSGCQSVWLNDEHLLGRTHYVSGQLVALWLFEPDGREQYCSYSAGRITSSKPAGDECPQVSDFPILP